VENSFRHPSGLECPAGKLVLYLKSSMAVLRPRQDIVSDGLDRWHMMFCGLDLNPLLDTHLFFGLSLSLACREPEFVLLNQFQEFRDFLWSTLVFDRIPVQIDCDLRQSVSLFLTGLCSCFVYKDAVSMRISTGYRSYFGALICSRVHA
jgi:hypothetical protein